MIPDTDLATAKQVRTAYGWFDFYNVTADTVVIVGDFDDYKIPRSLIQETRP